MIDASWFISQCLPTYLHPVDCFRFLLVNRTMQKYNDDVLIQYMTSWNRPHGMWTDGWFQTVEYIQKEKPLLLHHLSKYEHTLYTILQALHPYSESVHSHGLQNAICGSFALHIAEYKIHNTFPQWTPGDIDFFMTQHNALSIVVEILATLHAQGCRLEIIERHESHSKSCPHEEETMTNGPVERSRIRKALNNRLQNTPAYDYSVLFDQKTQHVYKTLKQLTNYDVKHYTFHLLDVMVNNTCCLSFILANIHDNIASVLNSFDLSVCQTAFCLQPQNKNVSLVMKPWIIDDIMNKRMCAETNEHNNYDAKVEKRIQKYMHRGYSNIRRRCICNKRCKGDESKCVCYGFFRSYQDCNCSSRECCKQNIMRPYDQRYYAFSPKDPTITTQKKCKHWCNISNTNVCCQCRDKRPPPEVNQHTNITHAWVNHTKDYCESCRWSYKW